MARDMVPVLKRCRSLGLDPIYLGVDKKSNRKLSLFMEFLKNLSETTLKKPAR